jgi:hypothetical protein
MLGLPFVHAIKTLPLGASISFHKFVCVFLGGHHHTFFTA